jgi:hypothetical protein
MATIKTITIEYGFTVGLSNYSSARAGIAFTAELAKGESPEDVIAALQDKAREIVHEEADRALVQDGKRPRFTKPEENKPDADDVVPF